MAFQFGFGEDDEAGSAAGTANLDSNTAAAVKSPLAPAREHKLEDLLLSLPERISYNSIRIESPTGKVVHLPRRELYDVRVQLICEGSANDSVIDQLEKSDLRSGVYEGGFKTWECSQDLASLLLDRGPRKDIDELIRCDQIIEVKTHMPYLARIPDTLTNLQLGAGTALPTLVLFRHALLNSIPMTFVLADYNEPVLRLVTLPNLILTWAATMDNPAFSLDNAHASPNDDLEITTTLTEHFVAELKSKSINLVFLSGAWSSSLASHIPPSAPDAGLLILAAETIYSPESTSAFVDLLVELLGRVKMSKAMVGAKRVYFGVGGSVDGLKETCRERGAVAYEIENHGVAGMDSGIGRALIEVQMY